MSGSSIHKLVVIFADAADEHGQATEAGDPDVGNDAYRRLSRAWYQLRLINEDWTGPFLELLRDRRAYVRLWVGSYALHIDHDMAVPVLEDLCVQPGLLGLNAQMTLEAWRSGQLNQPS